jgi:hypothetical protein
LITNQSIASLFLPTFVSYMLVIFGLLLTFQHSDINTLTTKILERRQSIKPKSQR